MRQAILLLVFLAAVTPAARAATTIEVQSDVAVAAAMVRLGDIALVDGAASDRMGSLVICPSPLAGQSLLLDRRRIRRRLLANLPAADFRLAGAETCTVTRTAESRPEPRTESQVVKDGPTQSLKTLLARVIGKRVDLPPEKYRVEFDQRDAANLSLTDDIRIFKLFNGPNERAIGAGAFRVEVSLRAMPEKVVRTLYVRYRVVLLAEVVVVARDIRPGEVLGRRDVRLERREFRTDKIRWLRNLGDAVGATARSALGVGQMVRPDDLTRTFYVRRGESVTVHLIGRGFSMKTRSRALESGELGSTIAVQGTNGKGRFYARVTDIRTVEVRLSGAPESPRKNTTQKLGDNHRQQLGKEDT